MPNYASIAALASDLSDEAAFTGAFVGQYATADRPAAADHAGKVLWDMTLMAFYESNGSAWSEVALGGGGGGGELLDEGSFADSSDSWGISTTSTTLVDVDSTNLVVDFTYPSSGRVRVVAEIQPHHSAGTTNAYIGLRTGSGIISGTSRMISRPGSNFVTGRSMFEWILTGTPGASGTARLAWATDGGSLFMVSGPNFGPWTIRAYSA